MSLVTDPNFLVHQMRIKFLRTDERGERMISFSANVVSNDYIRTAAPVYPEMHLCYSPVYDNPLIATNILTNSPRTMRSGMRPARKKDMNPPHIQPPTNAVLDDSNTKASIDSAEDFDVDDIDISR
jgi:hypothetical protein